MFNFPKKLSSIDQILNFFTNTQIKLFYVGQLLGTALLNVNEFMPSFQIITCNDPYNGQYPFIKAPQSFKTFNGHKCTSFVNCTLGLLKNPQVIQYMKSKGTQVYLMFLHYNKEMEELCNKHGFNVFFVSSETYEYLNNKIETIQLLEKAKIPYIPNSIMRIQSYEKLLKDTSNFGTQKLVIQNQTGAGGFGTYFINNKKDYDENRQFLQNGELLKVMPFKNVLSVSIAGVSTQSGTFIAQLQSQLIGHSDLTPYRGGFCGSEIRKRYFSEDKQIEQMIKERIFNLTQKFANFLYQQGIFRGLFGYDFVVDVDSNEVYFVEINPRVTGSNNLTFQTHEIMDKKFLFILFHFLEYLNIKIDLDVKALNKESLQIKNNQDEYSFVVFRPLTEKQTDVSCRYTAGVWRLNADTLQFTGKKDFLLKGLKQDEVYLLPSKGMVNLCLLMKNHCQDQNYKLTPEFTKIVKNIKNVLLQ